MNTINPVVEPYLFFNGNCEDALQFYASALGAKVEALIRFKDSPEPPPGFEDKIMHGLLRVGTSAIMASDGCNEEKSGFQGFSLAIAVTTEAEADRVFAALSEGGQVQMPLSKTFWSPRFGMLTDRFGIGWMVNTVPAGQK